jgi:hypothetical protein
MASSLRALGGRLFNTLGGTVGNSPDTSEFNDDEGLELQVHEKEDVELDVLNLKGREVAVGKDQGHIIDLGATDGRDARLRRRPDPARPEGEYPKQRGRHPALLPCVREASKHVYVSSWKYYGVCRNYMCCSTFCIVNSRLSVPRSSRRVQHSA